MDKLNRNLFLKCMLKSKMYHDLHKNIKQKKKLNIDKNRY